MSVGTTLYRQQSQNPACGETRFRAALFLDISMAIDAFSTIRKTEEAGMTGGVAFIRVDQQGELNLEYVEVHAPDAPGRAGRCWSAC